MENITLKPKKAELTGMVAGLAALSVIMLVFPVSSPVLTFAVPLLACPLSGHRKQQAVAWISTCIPAIAMLLAGYDLLLSFSLLLPGTLLMGLTRFLQKQKRMNPADMLWYMAALAVSVSVILAALTHALDGNLVQRLADAVISAIEASDQRAALLYRLAASGLISVPEGYGQGGLMGQLMEATHSRQMLMSLRLTLETLITNALPSLCVQLSLIVGMFACLRVQHMNGVVVVVEINRENPTERRAHVSAPPGFRLFYLPRAIRWTAVIVAFVSLMLKTGGGTLEWTLGTMGYAVFETLFRLEGAAIAVFMLTRRDEDRAVMAGILACAIYVLAPGVLMVMALLEPVFHFRSPQDDNPDEE